MSLRRLRDLVLRGGRLSTRPPLILMYHRIAEPLVDPWDLAVLPRHFEEQLEVLRRSRCPLPMSELVMKLEEGSLPDGAVGMTFDDGYVDNLHEATPRLAASDVPATFFVASGTIGSATEYWWDELARIILRIERPLDAGVMIAGEPYRFSLPLRRSADADGTWRAWEEPRTERQHAYIDLWERLRTASPDVRESAMKDLRDQIAPQPARAEDLPMSRSELAELAAHSLFEVGGHTLTHPVLPSLEPDARRDEILSGKLVCERAIERPLQGFAYPHGAWDADCRTAVQESGFTWACSTQSTAVPLRNFDRYALPRVWVHDWDGDAFARALEAVSV